MPEYLPAVEVQKKKAEKETEPPNAIQLRALTLVDAGMSVKQTADVIKVNSETVRSWIEKYNVNNAHLTSMAKMLAGAGYELSAKCARELHNRLDAGQRFTNGELGILFGISAQRSKELAATSAGVGAEPDWTSLSI